MKPGDLVRTRYGNVRLWNEDQTESRVIDFYPKRNDLLLILEVRGDSYYHRAITLDGIEGYILESEVRELDV